MIWFPETEQKPARGQLQHHEVLILEAHEHSSSDNSYFAGYTFLSKHTSTAAQTTATSPATLSYRTSLSVSNLLSPLYLSIQFYSPSPQTSLSSRTITAYSLKNHTYAKTNHSNQFKKPVLRKRKTGFSNLFCTCASFFLYVPLPYKNTFKPFNKRCLFITIKNEYILTKPKYQRMNFLKCKIIYFYNKE